MSDKTAEQYRGIIGFQKLKKATLDNDFIVSDTRFLNLAEMTSGFLVRPPAHPMKPTAPQSDLPLPPLAHKSTISFADNFKSTPGCQTVSPAPMPPASRRILYRPSSGCALPLFLRRVKIAASSRRACSSVNVVITSPPEFRPRPLGRVFQPPSRLSTRRPVCLAHCIT